MITKQPLNTIKLPWYSSLFIALIYTCPFIIMTPLILLTGIFSLEEMQIIFSDFFVNLVVILIFVIGIYMGYYIHKVVKRYDGSPESAKKLNNRIKRIDTMNIGIPILLMILISVVILHAVKAKGLQLEAFEGTKPNLFIFALFIGSLLDLGLLFYVLQIRTIEPRLADIPFKSNEMPLNIFQRNVLTLAFSIIGCLCLIIITLTPRNLTQGGIHLYRRLMPIFVYDVAYFAVVSFLLTDDIKQCLQQISAVTNALSHKDYTVDDKRPSNRSELGLIIQGINEFKNSAADILREIEISTKKTSNQSDDLVHNMDLTKDNVLNIVNAISSVKHDIENQSAGVEESNSSIEQIMGNIRSLNHAIESQSAGVTQSSAAVEEMVANITSVTQILEKNNQVVNELTQAADKGQQQVQIAVHTADDVLQQSESILQASSIIQGIASRTNLLAMNAAIESAHAGEAGKGFAVVADEIRKLAEQSSSQSKAIDENLHSLSEAIAGITTDINLVQTAFENIYKLSQKVRDQESVIANAMEEQNSGNQQVLEAMRSISNSTVEVKNGSTEMLVGGEQILKEMKNLSDVTRNISDNMNQIKDFSQQISDAVSITTASTTSTQESLSALMAELNTFKLN